MLVDGNGRKDGHGNGVLLELLAQLLDLLLDVPDFGHFAQHGRVGLSESGGSFAQSEGIREHQSDKSDTILGECQVAERLVRASRATILISD